MRPLQNISLGNAGIFLGDIVPVFWRNFLLNGLGWCVYPYSIKATPQQPRQPSWSWAAVYGAWYPGRGSTLDFHGIIEMVDCTTVLKCPNLPSGPVVSGQVKLKGPFTSIVLGAHNTTV
jgi:hypothetical protein